MHLRRELSEVLGSDRDDVEAGDEKIKELESEMKECGLYDSDFSLGDLLDEGGEETGTPQPAQKKIGGLPCN